MTFDPIEAAKQDAMNDPEFIAMMKDPAERDLLKQMAMSYGYTQQQVNRSSLPRLMDWAEGRKSKARYGAA
jgi:hypothetical protein